MAQNHSNKLIEELLTVIVYSSKRLDKVQESPTVVLVLRCDVGLFTLRQTALLLQAGIISHLTVNNKMLTGTTAPSVSLGCN